MVSKEKINFTIDDYIKDSIETIKAYFILYVIISLVCYFIEKTHYLFLIVLLFELISIISKINTYFNLKKIKAYLVKQDLLSKIGKIEFWNNSYYFLTENYMIIKKRNIIYAFKYSEIKKIYKKMDILLSNPSHFDEYLYIETKDNIFKILTWTLSCVEEDYRDISDYLIKKNPHIIVEVKNKK